MKVKKEKQPKLSAEAERSLPPSARYVSRMRRFMKEYRLLVLCMGVVSALAIVVAVVANVLVGLCAAVAVVVIYTRYKREILQKHLHLRCESAAEGLSIIALSADGADTLFVPARLMGLRITELRASAFADEKNATVTALHLPATLKVIGRDALVGLDALETVFFEGSQSEWDALWGETDFGGISFVPNTPYPSLATAPTVESATSDGDGEAAV